MASKSKIAKALREPKFSTRRELAADFADDLERSTASSESVESVFVNWPTRERSPALEKQAGKGNIRR